jgi:hypothetical protein
LLGNDSVKVPLLLLGNGSIKIPLLLLGNSSVKVLLSLLGNGSIKLPLLLLGNGPVKIFLSFLFLAYFHYFEKMKVGLGDHVVVCVYVCVSPIIARERLGNVPLLLLGKSSVKIPL